MKDYLAMFLASVNTRTKNENLREIVPTKPTKTSSEGFVGTGTVDLQKNELDSDLLENPLGVCPICTGDLIEEESKALTVRFCPFGCPVAQHYLKTESEAVTNEMLKAATIEEIDAMLDALNEREAVMVYNGMTDEQAAIRAEGDLLATVLDYYERRVRFSKV